MEDWNSKRIGHRKEEKWLTDERRKATSDRTGEPNIAKWISEKRDRKKGEIVSLKILKILDFKLF